MVSRGRFFLVSMGLRALMNFGALVLGFLGVRGKVKRVKGLGLRVEG